QRADDGRGKAGAHAQHHAVHQRLEHGAVGEQRFVPAQGKAAPDAGDLVVVERIHRHQRDGQVQDDKDDAEEHGGQLRAVLHSRPSSSVEWVTRLYTEIISEVSSINTTLSAAANGQLCAFISWSWIRLPTSTILLPPKR